MTSTVRSMTGFGAARRDAGGVVAEVEARSVNNRHLAVSIRAPSAFDARQPEIEALVRTKLQRGSVNVSISVRSHRKCAPGRIVAGVVEDYLRQLADAGLPAPPEVVGDLLRLPGAVEDAEDAGLTDAEFEAAAQACEAALVALVSMREREGAALATELTAGIDDVARLAAAVEARVPEAVRAAQERLKERLAALLGDAAVPAELVAREVAVLADRSDVAEEVARLASHVAQWREALASGGPIGRRLDFLAQEMGREVNTIGSKSQDTEIARAVVDLKVAVERLKEQAANVE
jgi:uncharacterized protein (TIGR00255 family)